MATLNDLLERRARVWDAAQKIIDDASARESGWTAEERQAYDKAEKDLDALTDQIEVLERHAQRAADFDKVDRSRVVATDATPAERTDDLDKAHRSAFAAYLRGGIANLTPEQRQTMLQHQSNDPELRAQAVGTNSAGGYLVPAEYRDEFIVKMKDYGAVINVATVITTDTGANLPWPTMDDTSNVGAILAENTQLAEQDLTIGTASLDAYMYTSKLTRASYQLIQDSGFDVEALVQKAHAERIGRITNQHFTTGTGTSQPDGIVTSATSGVTAAGVAAITADELLDLIHSVDPAYRNERSRFMLSDTALKAIRKLKDSNGMYLWQPNVQAGTAASLFGYPYVINQDMAVPATGVKSVLFGDFEAGYVIRIVRQLQTIVFTERYADYLQVGYTSFMRADGTLQNGSAYKALTQA